MKFLEFFFRNEIDNTKHTCHSYIENYYDILFSNINKEKQYNILEIGVRDGSSIEIWKNWFVRSNIYGIDINNHPSEDERVKIINGDAYSENIINMFEDNFFDYIIDDGPHTVESQQYSISNWMKKLKPNGKLIVEDIGCRDGVPNPPISSEWALEQLLKIIPDSTEYKIFDLRKTGQYDSIILELIKK